MVFCVPDCPLIQHSCSCRTSTQVPLLSVFPAAAFSAPPLLSVVVHEQGPPRQHVPPPDQGAHLHEGKLPPQLSGESDCALGQELPARQPRRHAAHRVSIRQGASTADFLSDYDVCRPTMFSSMNFDVGHSETFIPRKKLFVNDVCRSTMFSSMSFNVNHS